MFLLLFLVPFGLLYVFRCTAHHSDAGLQYRITLRTPLFPVGISTEQTDVALTESWSGLALTTESLW